MVIQTYYCRKIFYVILSCTIIFSFTSCKKPFNTNTTDDDIFELSINHSIIRVMPSALVNLSWNEVTVEDFKNYIIERKTFTDTAWTDVTMLEDAFKISYVDTIVDDDDLIYRVGIADINDNILWDTATTLIPKTTAVIVPDELNTIQTAFTHGTIDDGDSIIVRPGMYYETLYIAGKDVLIKSTEGYNATFLLPTPLPDSLDQLRVVNITSGILDGFSVQKGTPHHGSGGGVAIGNNATVQNCYIEGNDAKSYKNGGYGGGVFIENYGNLYNNIITNNSCFRPNSQGIYALSAHGEIINNTIVGNDIAISGDCSGLLMRNNIIHNSEPDITFDNIASQTGVTIDYSLFDFDIGFGTDNKIDDPQFIDNVDFKLSPTSLCVDTGHPDAQYYDSDGTRNDRGAYGGPRSRL